MTSLFGYGIGRVLRSEDPDVQVGDHIYGIIRMFLSSSVTITLIHSYIKEHEEYHVYKKNELDSFKVLDNKYGLPWSVFVGAAGMPGKAAYYAWKLFANAKQVGLDASPRMSLLI